MRDLSLTTTKYISNDKQHFSLTLKVSSLTKSKCLLSIGYISLFLLDI